MPFLNPKLGIDFSNYIADRTLNFTGRGWVFEAIQNWLADSNGDRFFLLTSEPGGGKTAIAARLAQFAQGTENCSKTKDYSEIYAGFLHAVFFCSARESTWTSPLEFSRTLAMQLAQSIPEFALALKDIEEKTVNINASITVGSAENSTIQAVVVQNLSIQGLSGQDAFDQVVVNPLRQIRGEGFSQPVTILVDSLDEALTHDKDIQNTIVNLLSKLSEDTEVRLILTSRNEGKVKDKFINIAYEELFISSPENLKRNEQDIQEYIDKQFRREEKLLNSLQIESLDQKTLTTKLIKQSEGNFLYVRFLLEAVALGQQSFANLDGLPQGLNELYYSSLGRVVEQGKKDWSKVYAPVMGVLLAAQESLTENQIRAFTQLEDSVVWDCLTDLQQFLDEVESEDEETLYKLYHQSVTDFLVKRQLVIRKKKLNNRYFLSGQEQHQRLLEYYRPENRTWNEVQLEKIDPYGLRYLATHLAEIAKISSLSLQHQHTKSLVELVTNLKFQHVHQAKLQDLAALQHDVELALRTASIDPDPLAVPLVIEMALASIAFQKTWLSPEPIFELARQGNIEAAEQRLNLFAMEPEWYQVAALMIAWLAAQQNPDKAKQLRDRVASNLSKEEPLPTLLKRLNAYLEDKTVLDLLPLPDVTASNIIEAILMRMGGVEDDELLIGAGINPLFSPSLLIEPNDEVPFYVSEQDGPLLVAYAVAFPPEGNQYLQQYIEIHSAYAYREYRNRSLMVLLNAILNHPEQEWVLQILPKIVAAAATGANYEFRDGLSLTLLGLQAVSGNLAATKQLKTYIQPIQQAIAQFHEGSLNCDPYEEEE